MKSPGPANTDLSSTAGYPPALYNTASGGGNGHTLYHALNRWAIDGSTRVCEVTGRVSRYSNLMFRPAILL